jgi:sialic acid synthase SpsE
MGDLGEVERALGILRGGGCPEVVLLHCTTNYPCPEAEVNLRAMATLREAFKTEVGYSDHTLGIEIPLAAVALGATVIEKHFTLDQGMAGPDHRASLNPGQLRDMVQGIRKIETALGDGIKRPNPSEERMKPRVRKRLVAARSLAAAATVEAGDVLIKRAQTGIEAPHLDLILGRGLTQSIEADEPFTWEHLFRTGPGC